ncbi:uncharacterized protein AAGF69_000949 [Amazona ochrocephala]
MPLYTKEEASMELLQTFVKSSVKGEAQRMQFLQTICTPCKAARDWGCSRGPKELYHRFQVAEKIQTLVEEEATDQLHVAMLQQAMLAIACMRYVPSPWLGWHFCTARGPGPGRGVPHPGTVQCKVQMALEGHKKSLLEACFRSIFFLLPRADTEGLDTAVYFRTGDLGQGEGWGRGRDPFGFCKD